MEQQSSNLKDQKKIDSANSVRVNSHIAPKKKKSKKYLFVGVAILSVALLFVALAYVFVLNRSGNKVYVHEIDIGSTRYSQSDIDKYTRGLEEYQNNNENAQKYEDPRQGAIDELVLNTALIKEASDKNLTLSDEEYKQALTPDEDPGNVAEYARNAKSYSDLSFVQTTRAENDAYRKKLQDQLIAKRKLLVSSVSFDTPFHYEQKSKDVIEGLHQQGIDRLKNELQPLYNQRASKDEIAKSSDVSNLDSANRDNTQDYFKKLITNTFYYDNYSTQPSDIDNVAPNSLLSQLETSNTNSSGDLIYSGQDFAKIKSSTLKDLDNIDYGAPVKDLKDTNKQIDNLKNIGEYTDIFASKSGSHMIVRLEDKSGGDYVTWSDFVSHYISQVKNDEINKPSLFESIKNIFSRKSKASNTAYAADALLPDVIPQTVPYIPAISADSDKTAGGASVEGGGPRSANSCSNHPFLMQVDTFEVAGSGANLRVVGPTAYAVKVKVQQSGGCGSLINGTAWAPFQANGNCMNGQPSVEPVEVAPGWELIGGVAQPWNTQNVNADGQWGVRYFVRRTGSTATTVTGNSYLIKSTDNRIFDTNTSRISGGVNAIAVARAGWASYYSNTKPTISHTWSATQNLTYQICAKAPRYVFTDNNTKRWTRNRANEQDCDNSVRNGGVATFRWMYDPPPDEIDVCPNIAGIQTEVPPGYILDDDGNCVLPTPSYYPWLQTQKGDVSSAGKVDGQELAVLSDLNSIRGGRHYSDVTDKSQPSPESSYVIAAQQAGGKNFCSSFLYALGVSIASQKQACETGGYNGDGTNYSDIRSSLNNAWSRNGAGDLAAVNNICQPYKTKSVDNPETNLSLGCLPGGGIQQITVDYDWNPAGQQISGRGTLWVKGDLTISGDIVYAPSGPVDKPALLPNLVIFVEGNITIDQTVTRIDASLVSIEGINSCAQSETPTPACGAQLKSYGYWASDGLINFERRYYNKDAPNENPAELIILTAQSVLFPPPGMSHTDGDINTQLQINSGELAPRLN